MKFECKQCGQCCAQFDKDSGGIMIFEWEKEGLENVARERKIPFKIEEGQTDYDAKSNTRIVPTWAFKAKSCPFLKDKKCSIHLHRPVYCKAYPLLVTMTKSKFDLKLLNCPNAKIPKLGMKEYYNSFGDIFLQALELEIFRHHYVDLMKGLKENELVEIRKEKLSDKPKTRSLFEFLVKNNFIYQKDADGMIRDILHLNNAKAMVGLI